MLLGRDGQLYVIDPLNINSPSSESLSYFSQEEREENIENLREWRDTSLSVLEEFNQNKGMNAIFVSKEMLGDDPKFEQSLLEKARKQQDLVIMSYDAFCVLHAPLEQIAALALPSLSYECVQRCCLVHQ
jgi:hypothetical protein